MPDTSVLLSESNRTRQRLVVTVAVVVVAACVLVWLQTRDSTPGPDGSTSISIRTNSWHTGQESNAAGGPAVVRVSADDCIFMELPGGGDGHALNVIWPAGYAASRAPDGTVTLYNEDDETVARDGTRIFAGGGTGSGPGCNLDATATWDMTIDLQPID